MKKKLKLSAYEKKVLLYWKTWYIAYGNDCLHPMMISLTTQPDMFSTNMVKEKTLWNWTGGTKFNIIFTQHFFDLLDNYD